MLKAPPVTSDDDRVRQSYAETVGVPLADVLETPVSDLRALLADVQKQVECYLALGFITEAEAAEWRPKGL